jgi:RNA polymerase sigma-70 factor (ECF subfamily)
MGSQVRLQFNVIGMASETSSSAHTSIRTLPAGVPIDVSGDSVLQRDQRLVCAAQSGCQKAFGELLNLYSRRIYRTILAITKNPEDAQDAMQDTHLRALLAIGRFEGRASFYSWVTRIAINSALMILRRRRNRQELSFSSAPDSDGEVLPLDVIDLAADPEESFYQQQRLDILVRAIDTLKPELRDAVRARVVEERSIKEIARRCNVSEAAVKSRLLRARTRLATLRTNGYGLRSRVGSSRSSVALPK